MGRPNLPSNLAGNLLKTTLEDVSKLLDPLRQPFSCKLGSSSAWVDACCLMLRYIWRYGHICLYSFLINIFHGIWATFGLTDK